MWSSSSRLGHARRDVAEGDDRELRLAAEVLELVAPCDLGVEEPRLAEVPLDRGTDRLRPVRAEREPHLERAERPRVLERDVDHVVIGPLVRDVVLLVRERAVQVLVAAYQHHPAGLRQEEPLVRVERHRVGPVETREEVSGGRSRSGRDAVGPVDVEPDAALLADVGERPDRVDRAGQRRAGGGDDGDGRDTRRAVCLDRGVDRVRAEPPRVVHLQGAHVVGADPEELRRSDDGVVRLLRAVERRSGARHALAP